MRTSEAIDGEYLSQDGKLCLRVQSSEGDITLGFDGYEWHTHGDVLVATYGGDPESATLRFLDDLLASKLTIAIARVSGAVRNIWITDNPASDRRRCPPAESVEFRFWNGATIS